MDYLQLETMCKVDVNFLGSNFGTKFYVANDFCFSFVLCHYIKGTHYTD